MKEKKEGQKHDAIKKSTKGGSISGREKKPVEGIKKESEKDVTVAPDATKEQTPTEKKRRHVRGIWAVTLILVFSTLLATAVWIYAISNANKETFSFLNTDISKKAAEEKKKEEEAKKGLKEYINLSALFSFDYPDTWTLGEQNNSLIISSDANYSKAYLSGENPEMKDTDIYIQIHFSNEPIDISREAPAMIKPKRTNSKVGSVSVTKTTYKGDEDFAEIISNFKAGDFLFTIIVDCKTKNADKIDAYNKMLASFKFGNEVIEATKNK
ncbi:MAG: hypothetical protein NT039_01060 [Candidatus Berkelbacteria bacterium]|nr:hypothetical protein [Candidatus Berkelbacteria bacterium]